MAHGGINAAHHRAKHHTMLDNRQLLSILSTLLGDYIDMMVDFGQCVLVRRLIKGVMALEGWGIYINKSCGE